MATRSSSRHRAVPINVVVERRARAKHPVAPILPPPSRPTSPPARVPAPTWSVARRRRVMWITVGIGSIVIIGGWVAIFSTQLRGDSSTFFTDVSRLVRNVNWPWERPAQTEKEQEIRQLEQQVFPQFQ